MVDVLRRRDRGRKKENRREHGGEGEREPELQISPSRTHQQ
jgi:hypothetical protein